MQQQIQQHQRQLAQALLMKQQPPPHPGLHPGTGKSALDSFPPHLQAPGLPDLQTKEQQCSPNSFSPHPLCEYKPLPLTHSMPVCSYFLKGICNNNTCPYSHVYVSRKAEVCQDFLKGYCPLGEKCKKKHTLLCPDFAKTGSCLLGSKCKLQHRQRKRPAEAPETRGVPKRAKTKQEQGGCVAVVAPGSEAGKDCAVEPEPEVAGPCPRLEKLPSYISLCSSPTEGEGNAGEPTGESADNTEAVMARNFLLEAGHHSSKQGVDWLVLKELKQGCNSPHGTGDPKVQRASTDPMTKPASFITQDLESGCQQGANLWRTKVSPAGICL
ncbi:ZC3H3 protein, partial [Polyodon spathula]|nr:ZC3H3 protein [Polyodon spathula]